MFGFGEARKNGWGGETREAIDGRVLVDDLSIADVSSIGDALIITSLVVERNRAVVRLPRE